jgi:glycosyltransferase involved in cell wall biosynthesis
VIFEAMSFGLAVISVNRGCLSEDVDPACGLIIDRSDDFVAAAHRQISCWCAARDELAAAQAASLARLEFLRAAAATDYIAMLRAIAVCSAD